MPSQFQCLFLFFIAAATLLLSGCTAMIRSDISAINKLPADLKDKSFHIAPYKGQEGNLEFEYYANLVSYELQAKGLRPAAPAQADLLVFIRYAFEQRTDLIPTPIWGPTGFIGGGGAMVSVNGRMVFVPTYPTPIYGVTGTTATPATVNRRTFNLDVVDKDSTQEKPHKLYEASVASEGYSGTLMQVVPTMIRALFTQWPGPPMRTDSVDLPLPQAPQPPPKPAP